VKILAMEKAGVGPGTVATQELLQSEALRAWELYQDGVIRELYFRGDRPSAVLVLECRDVEEARQILDTLPLVAAGLIGFEIHGLVPYPGFARLFAKH
jgi:hypothetical protein